jgi:hypothetical protein
VPEIHLRASKQIQYSISSIGGKDLDITKINDKVVVSLHTTRKWNSSRRCSCSSITSHSVVSVVDDRG